MHVDADHLTAWREPHLALAGEQHVAGLMLLLADHGVLAIWAKPPAGSGARPAHTGAASPAVSMLLRSTDS